MSSPLRLLRKASIVGATTRGIFVNTRSTCQLVKFPAVVNGGVRSLSSQPEKAVCYEDLVKETLKKMISERGTENLTKVIADEDLERRFQHYSSLLKEAESCIEDLREATPDQRDEEFVCASGAVDTAFEAYVDLLDDLRKANEEQLKAYQEVRDQNARKFMRLRRELAEILASNAAQQSRL